MTEALNGADASLFCRDTGSTQGRSVFFSFLVCFSTYFKNQNIYLKKIRAVEAAKSNRSSSKTTFERFAHKEAAGKTEFFCKRYFWRTKRKSTIAKQLRNYAFHVKRSQSAKSELDPAKNENRPKKRYAHILHKRLQLLV